MVRESALRGAFANPGPLKPAPGMQAAAQQVDSATSPPIKAELIGKPDDAQLKAALTYLHRTVGTEDQSR